MIFEIKERDDVAMECYNRAIEILKNRLGEDCIDLCSIYEKLGGVFQRHNSLDKALRFYEKSISIRERNLFKRKL